MITMFEDMIAHNWEKGMRSIWHKGEGVLKIGKTADGMTFHGKFPFPHHRDLSSYYTPHLLYIEVRYIYSRGIMVHSLTICPFNKLSSSHLYVVIFMDPTEQVCIRQNHTYR